MRANADGSDSRAEANARVLALVERDGWNATAFQTLEDGYSYFFHGERGCVAYVDIGSAWVAAGAPLADEGAIAEVALAFEAAAHRAGKRCCFFATEERFAKLTGMAFAHVRLGEQPVWDPSSWPATLARHRSLREQLRRARAKGVVVRELSPAETSEGPVRSQIEALVRRWLSTRPLAPMEFLVRVDPFGQREHRRCFAAELGGRIVAFAGLIPVPARPGWFLENLVRDPRAPNGTGELLVDSVMRWAEASGSRWVTLGLAPLSGRIAKPLQLVRQVTRFLYDFEGLRSFKAKLRPTSWVPISLSYPKDQGGVISLIDALSAFTGDGFLRFGWRSLLRGPRFAVRALTVLLAPWIVVLALSPAERWFPSPAIKWAWVVFDVLVLAALVRVLREPSSRWVTPLCIAVTLDAILTATQAVLWNFEHARHTLDYLVVLVACAAPVLASVVLWGARRTRSSAR